MKEREKEPKLAEKKKIWETREVKNTPKKEKLCKTHSVKRNRAECKKKEKSKTQIKIYIGHPTYIYLNELVSGEITKV